MSKADLAAHIGRLIERIDCFGDGDEFACNVPLDDEVFADEDIDKVAFIEELIDAMAGLGLTVKEARLIDGEGIEHPFPVRRPAWHFHYLLDKHGQEVATDDLYAVGRLLYNREARTVARTYFVHRRWRVEVSTVFTVFNHASLPGADPVLWESRIFTKFPVLDGTQMRYTSRNDAIEGHQWLVAYAKKFLRQQCSLRPRRKPTIHQAFAALRRQRRYAREEQRRQGGAR